MQGVGADSVFTIPIFDGWNSCFNVAVLRFMIYYFESSWRMVIKCFKMTGGHSAAEMSHLIDEVILKRLAKKVPTYFFSVSALFNKLAVQINLGEKGDEYWFYCAVPFCRLATNESILFSITSRK